MNIQKSNEKFNMRYWYYNKQTETPQIFSSITQIAKGTELKKDKLYYHFTKKKRECYIDDIHVIAKLTVNESTGVKIPMSGEIPPEVKSAMLKLFEAVEEIENKG